MTEIPDHPSNFSEEPSAEWIAAWEAFNRLHTHEKAFFALGLQHKAFVKHEGVWICGCGGQPDCPYCPQCHHPKSTHARAGNYCGQCNQFCDKETP